MSSCASWSASALLVRITNRQCDVLQISSDVRQAQPVSGEREVLQGLDHCSAPALQESCALRISEEICTSSHQCCSSAPVCMRSAGGDALRVGLLLSCPIICRDQIREEPCGMRSQSFAWSFDRDDTLLAALRPVVVQQCPCAKEVLTDRIVRVVQRQERSWSNEKQQQGHRGPRRPVQKNQQKGKRQQLVRLMQVRPLLNHAGSCMFHDLAFRPSLCSAWFSCAL